MQIRPRHAALLLTVMLTLGLATGAQAATIGVDPAKGDDGGCARDGAPCKTLSKAESISQDNDVISLSAGNHFGGPVTFDRNGITLKGAGLATIVATVEDGTSLTFTGTTPKLQTLVAAQVLSDQPAVTASKGLEIIDAFVVSTKGGPAVNLTGGAGRIIRSNVLSTGGTAVGLVSPATGDGAPNTLLGESSILSASAAGAAIYATSPSSSSGQIQPSTADDISITLRHMTLAGDSAAKGLRLDASTANGSEAVCVPPLPCVGTTSPRANMTANVTNSIIKGANETKANGPDQPGADNTVTINYSGANDTGADPAHALLFANPAKSDFSLRADAPDIDKGGAPASDESATDIHGEPRVSGAASDLGADEFVNKAPKASLKATSTSPPAKQPVGFVSTSSDPEQNSGGGIVEYRWDFGDGASEKTTLAYVGHVYENPGSYQVRLTVVDRQGAEATSEPLTINVGPVADTAPPGVAIIKPANNAKLILNRKPRAGSTKVPAPLRLALRGVVFDISGIKQVEISIKLAKRDKGRTRKCEWLLAKKFKVAPCDKPVWVKVNRDKNTWSFRTPAGFRLPAGRYELRVRGIDLFGNTGTEFTTALKTLVFIRVK